MLSVWVEDGNGAVASYNRKEWPSHCPELTDYMKELQAKLLTTSQLHARIVVEAEFDVPLPPESGKEPKQR